MTPSIASLAAPSGTMLQCACEKPGHIHRASIPLQLSYGVIFVYCVVAKYSDKGRLKEERVYSNIQGYIQSIMVG